MQIFPSDEQAIELLQTCGKKEEEDFISFELFARSIALLLEENLEKITTSSQAHEKDQMYENESENQIPDSQLEDYGAEDDHPDLDPENQGDPYYDEYNYAEAAAKHYQ